MAEVPKDKLEFLETVDGRYSTILSKKYKERIPWTVPDPRQMISYIPGTISELLVVVGQKVKKGDPLMTFNAMKMSNTYSSPCDGTVARLLVQPGEVVPKGVVVLEFE